MKKKAEEEPNLTPDPMPDQQGEGATEATKEIPSTDQERRLAKERDQLADQLQRALADLQNARKRHQREIEDVRKRAVETLARELVPVLDNFQLALAAHEMQEVGPALSAATHSMIEGLRMVQSLLTGALERHGLAEIPALGTAFDPNQHEAVGIDPSSAASPGQITQVLQRGYSLGERVLRPSKVLVSGERAPDEPKS